MNERDRSSGRRLHAAGWVLALLGLHQWLYGYEVGLYNHAIQLPFLDRALDPGLFPADPFVATRVTYTTYAWSAVAWASELVPRGALFLAAHLAVHLAVLGAVFSMARAVSPSRPFAPYLASWLFLVCDSEVGGQELHSFYFNHTELGYAIGLWSVALRLHGRRVVAWLLTGLLFNVHALQGVYTGLVLAAVDLWHWRTTLRSSRGAVAPLAAGLLATPALLWILRSGGGASPELFAELMRDFYPRHFFPDALTVRDWRHLGWQVGLLAAGCLWDRPGHAGARVAAAAILAFLAAGGAAVQLHPTPRLIQLHVLRVAAYLGPLAMVVGAPVLVAWVDRLGEAVGPRAARGIALATLALATSAVVGRVPVPGLGRQWPLVLGAVLAVAAPLALLGRGLPAGVRLAVGTSLLAVSGALGGAVLLERQRATDRDRDRLAPWMEVQRWARESTEVDARFATPPLEEGFRALSQRSTIGEYRDVAAVLWSPGYAETWLAWYGGLVGEEPRPATRSRRDHLQRVWRGTSPGALVSWARGAGARYLVLDRRFREEQLGPDAEVVFRSGDFTVVELQG